MRLHINDFLRCRIQQPWRTVLQDQSGSLGTALKPLLMPPHLHCARSHRSHLGSASCTLGADEGCCPSLSAARFSRTCKGCRGMYPSLASIGALLPGSGSACTMHLIVCPMLPRHAVCICTGTMCMHTLAPSGVALLTCSALVSGMQLRPRATLLCKLCTFIYASVKF